MVGFSFSRTRQTARTSTTDVKEVTGPRRHHDTLDRVELYDEVSEAVEMDKQRFSRRIRRTLAFVIVALVVAAIVDIACHDNVRTWLETSFDWIEANPRAGERRRGERGSTELPSSFCNMQKPLYPCID